MNDRDHQVLYGIVAMLAKAYLQARRANWRWGPPGARLTWADTVEADLLRAAAGLLLAEETARPQGRVRPPLDERVSVREREDLERFLLHQARTQLYGLNLKREKRRDVL